MKRTLREVVELIKRNRNTSRILPNLNECDDDDIDEFYNVFDDVVYNDEDDRTLRGLSHEPTSLTDTKWWCLRFKRCIKHRYSNGGGCIGSNRKIVVREGSYVAPLYEIGSLIEYNKWSQINDVGDEEIYDMVSPLREESEEKLYFNTLSSWKNRGRIYGLSDYGG